MKLALLIPVVLVVFTAFLLRGSSDGSIPYEALLVSVGLPVALAVVAAKFLLRGSNHGSIPYDTDRTELNEEYDFIVVGAGSAGSVVASRLSENKHVTVLLLEAGGDDNLPAVKVPLAASSLVGTERDWKYKVRVQTVADSEMESVSLQTTLVQYATALP